MTHTPWTIALALVATLGFMTTSAAALGPEFQVNTYTSGDQYQPAVAMDPSGSGFVVAWTGDGLGYAHNGVFAQRLDSSGMKLGTEFRLSGFTANVQFQPSIAFRSAGEFVVVWTSDGQDGSGTTVMGRLFDSTGMSQGSEFRVNTYTTGGQQRASVASNAAGDFVVVWEGDLEDGSYRGVFGQRFDSAGATVGGEFQVNTYTTGYQYFPAIGGDGTGAFVVTWTSVGQDGDQGGVFAQRLDSDGSPAGSEFRVSTNTAGRQATASVAPDGSGGFVVAWMDAYQDGDYAGVFAQRFDSDGDPVGTEFQVNTYTTSFQSRPAVAQNGAGFVVAWSSYGQDGEYAGVFGRRFSSSGAPASAEFQINAYTTDNQYPPSISGSAQGGFAVVWSSFGQDGDGYGVFGKNACADADSDGVCDVDDISITSPTGGASVDCADPKNVRPTITWTAGNYDKFQIQIAPNVGFFAATRVTSGSTLTTATSYTPPGKKWKSACARAVAANAMAPVLFLRISGVDTHVPRSAPTRKTFSQVVQVGVSLM